MNKGHNSSLLYIHYIIHVLCSIILLLLFIFLFSAIDGEIAHGWIPPSGSISKGLGIFKIFLFLNYIWYVIELQAIRKFFFYYSNEFITSVVV